MVRRNSADIASAASERTMRTVDLAAIGYWLTFEYEQDATPSQMVRLLARLRERCCGLSAD